MLKLLTYFALYKSVGIYLHKFQAHHQTVYIENFFKKVKQYKIQ